MQVGIKAQGDGQGTKVATHRHTTTFSKSSAHRLEKAAEVRVRQSGRRACQETV